MSFRHPHSSPWLRLPAVAAASCLLFLAIPVLADTYAGPNIPVCAAPSWQESPGVSAWGNILRVVWQDHRSGNADIYMLEHPLKRGKSGKVTQKPVFTGPGNQTKPRVFGKYVVWEDDRNGNLDIYAKNLKTGEMIPVCVAAGDQKNPQMFGPYVVWEDHRGGANGDIYLRNLCPDGLYAVETPVCTDSADQGRPDIYCNDITGTSTPTAMNVVWDDGRSGTSYDIYFKDMVTNTEYKISSPATTNEFNPKVYLDWVYWDDYRNGATSGWDVYGNARFSGSWYGEFPLASGPDHQFMQDAGYEGYVYVSGNSGNMDLYCIVSSTNSFPVSVAPGNQQGAAISHRYIVWGDFRTGSGDIYLSEIVASPPAGLPLMGKPKAVFSVFPALPKVNRFAGIVDKTSWKGVGKTLWYYWDFDRDGKPDSNSYAPFTVYTTPGTKRVRLAIGRGLTGSSIETPNEITKWQTKRITVG